MNDAADFKRCCRNDYIEMAAQRGQSFLLEEADQCDEASVYLRSMAKEDPAYTVLAKRASYRAAEARRVFGMLPDMLRAAARDIKRSRRQQKGRQS